ncbi:hypothetical protein WA026_019834 [Henosepilachna vigintioctopunctata]|uniref:Uncharacterized protein n=1 Tax=Henosepilachna vigintioctopunctata TaxID=420089 RepID=A0AAW1VIP6_9CUCU
MISTSEVEGVDKRKWVYVEKNYGQEVTEIDMKEFLIDSTGTEDFVMNKLSTKSPNSAFSEGVPTDALFELLLKPESWPNGVVLRKFNFENFFRAGKRKVMNQELETCQKQGLVNSNENGHIDVGNEGELGGTEKLKNIMNHENRPDRIKRMCDAGTSRSAFVKRQRMELVKRCEDNHQPTLTNDEHTATVV